MWRDSATLVNNQNTCRNACPENAGTGKNYEHRLIALRQTVEHHFKSYREETITTAALPHNNVL